MGGRFAPGRGERLYLSFERDKELVSILPPDLWEPGFPHTVSLARPESPHQVLITSHLSGGS